MQACEVGPKRPAQPRVALGGALAAGQAVAAGVAGQGLHDEEIAPDHLWRLAQPQWLGHLHAHLVSGAEHGELLLAAHAGGHGGSRIGAQYPTLRHTGNLGLDQPVLLDGAA
ncbi:hypothetical protein D3C79_958060 [compost metagenome]